MSTASGIPVYLAGLRAAGPAHDPDAVLAGDTGKGVGADAVDEAARSMHMR
jgi:hypothetical protein